MHNADRDAEIVRRYLLPTSIGKLATEYGVSRQRIEQIVRGKGAYRPRIETSIPGGPKQTRDAIAAGTRPDWRLPPGGRTLDIITLREADPDKSYQKIANELGVALSTVATTLKRWRPDLLRGARGRGPVNVTVASQTESV